MSPREATQTDPMQRLALTTAYEAMEMAGFVRDRTPSTQYVLYCALFQEIARAELLEHVEQFQ